METDEGMLRRTLREVAERRLEVNFIGDKVGLCGGKVSVKCLETKINIQHSAQMESLFFLCCRLINGKSKYNRGKNDIRPCMTCRWVVTWECQEISIWKFLGKNRALTGD